VELADRLDHLLMIRDVALCAITPSRTILLEGTRSVVDSMVDQLLAEGWVDLDGEVVRLGGALPADRRARLAFYLEAP
jgi:hypothetical protein